MSSNNDKEPDYITAKGTKLRFGSYWCRELGYSGPSYFRLVTIQDSAGGLHAVVATSISGWAGLHLEAFDNGGLREVTDEDEIALAALSLV